MKIENIEEAKHFASKAREMVRRAREERSEPGAYCAYTDRLLDAADGLDALAGEVEEHRQDAANLRDLNETMGRNLRHLHGRVAAKSRRVDELEAALRFYADPESWREIEQPLTGTVTDYDDEGNKVERVEKFWGVRSRIDEDGGSKARAALSGGERKEGEA